MISLATAVRTALETYRDDAPVRVRVTKFNRERMELALATMKEVAARGYAFDLGSWYGGNMDVRGLMNVNTERLHKCGTSACAMGWIATTPDWLANGGMNDMDESALSFPDASGKQNYGVHAAMAYLGLSEEIAYALFIDALHDARHPELFGLSSEDISARDLENMIIDAAHESDEYLVVRTWVYGKQRPTAQNVVDNLEEILTTGYLTLMANIGFSDPSHENFINLMEEYDERNTQANAG